MSFQLTITFSGMCLLVNDTKEDRLQVLLPPTGRPGGGNGHHAPRPGGAAGDGPQKGIPLHLARLIYDPVHERQDGPPSHEVDVPPEDHVPLENTSIDLSGLKAGSGFDPEMPKEVVNLGLATPKPVNRALFHGDTGGRVLTRITLARGKPGKPLGGGRFRLGSRPGQHMATAVEWTIDDVEGDFLVLDLDPMGGGPGDRQLELYPTRDRKLNLYVFHSPDDDLPVRLPPKFKTGLEPGEPREAIHFASYYNLIDGLDEKPPVPVYEGDAAEKAQGDQRIKGLKITCATATASV